MAKRSKPYIELDGPVFDPDVQRILISAVDEGLEALGDEASGILVGFIHQAGFVKTGAFARSVDSELRKRRDTEVGYVKVQVTDAWPKPDRPTREWLVTGRRNGVKLRKGNGVFAKTNTRLNDFAAERIEGILEKALN